MFQMTALIALAKVGTVLVWCVARGVSIRPGLWHHIIPRFSLDLEVDQLRRLVHISSWLAVAALAVGFALAELQRREHQRVFDRRHPAATSAAAVVTPQPAERNDDRAVISYDAWLTGARRAGTRFGAYVGGSCLSTTLVLEHLVYRVDGRLDLPSPSVGLTVGAAVPVIGLATLTARRTLTRPTDATPFVRLFAIGETAHTAPPRSRPRALTN